jgi:hypothetical protein
MYVSKILVHFFYRKFRRVPLRGQSKNEFHQNSCLYDSIKMKASGMLVKSKKTDDYAIKDVF